MVELALLIGIFAYFVYGVGLLGGLGSLGYLGIGFTGSLIVLGIKKTVWRKISSFWQEVKKEKLCLVFLGLILLQAMVNLIGVLGPELGFDALWYHLTIPKIYLQQEKVFFIPGNLFYYSAMPKLTEMLYLASLTFSPGGTLAKAIHFSFGILSAVALFNLAKRYLETKESLLTVLIFYTTLIVGWESITAYIDLARTFFEILALGLFLEWKSRKDKRDQKDPTSSRCTSGLRGASKKDKILLIESAVMLGLAISTKLLAFATLPVFLIIVFLKSKKVLTTVRYLLTTLVVPLPWLVFSYLYTGNPIYPIFSGILDQGHRLVGFNPARFLGDFWLLLYRPQDPISPIFLIFIPVVLRAIFKGRQRVVLKTVATYTLLALIFWYFTPRTGGSRFILPYLPASAFLTVGVVSQKMFLKKVLVWLAIIVAIVNIGYRALANKKFIPVLLGRQTKDQFLAKNLNFQNGDFYDLNGELKKIIKNDLTLISGSHNLFYVDFPFIHSSYTTSSLPFSYVLVQNADLLKNVSLGGLVYENQKSGVKLYWFKRSP